MIIKIIKIIFTTYVGKMFLNRLNLDQRKAFIEIAYITAKIDGIFAEEEKLLIESYKGEIGIIYYELKNTPLTECIAFFDTKESQKILLIEILGLIYSDGKFVIEESNLLKELSEYLNYTDDNIEYAKNWIENYYTQVSNASKFIAE